MPDPQRAVGGVGCAERADDDAPGTLDRADSRRAAEKRANEPASSTSGAVLLVVPVAERNSNALATLVTPWPAEPTSYGIPPLRFSTHTATMFTRPTVMPYVLGLVGVVLPPVMTTVPPLASPSTVPVDPIWRVLPGPLMTHPPEVFPLIAASVRVVPVVAASTPPPLPIVTVVTAVTAVFVGLRLLPSLVRVPVGVVPPLGSGIWTPGAVQRHALDAPVAAEHHEVGGEVPLGVEARDVVDLQPQDGPGDGPGAAGAREGGGVLNLRDRPRFLRIDARPAGEVAGVVELKQ